MKNFIKSNYASLLVLTLALVLTFIISSFVIIQKHSSLSYKLEDKRLDSKSEDINVGIVFGTAVNDSEPLPLLKDRLNTAKQLLDKGYVNKLILSGDNRQLDYNEPAIMYDYLVKQGVEPDKLQADFAGRSTYETCERAKKIFRVNEAILISESVHLPRAIYLCKSFNIDVIGVQSDGAISTKNRLGQTAREVLARNKAIYNIYIDGEDTVLGEPININD